MKGWFHCTSSIHAKDSRFSPSPATSSEMEVSNDARANYPQSLLPPGLSNILGRCVLQTPTSRIQTPL